MGFLTRVEDRPTPSAVYNWRLWVLSFIASFASIMIGYVYDQILVQLSSRSNLVD